MAVRSGASYRLSAILPIVMAQLFGIAAITLVLIWAFHFRDGVSLTYDDKQRLINVKFREISGKMVHPVLMLIGLIYFAGQAIMAFKILPATRNVRKFVHMALHLVALLLGALGLLAVFKSHKKWDVPHMYTLHSWLGMGTICLFALQWLIAFLFFLFPGAQMTTGANMVAWHAFFGVVIFLMAICTAETGLLQGVFRDAELYVVNFTGIVILLFGISVTLAAILPNPV